MKRHNRPAGFTLIELIIVAAIIVVLAVVSTPLFRRTFRDMELQDAAYDVTKIIQYAQQKAVIEEKKYRLAFYFDSRSYRLLFLSEDDSDWKEAAGRFGGYFYLPEGVKFKGEQDKITFLPNGRCDKISICIIGREDKTFEITTNGRAGYVKLFEVN